jgi:hypothetical protein
MIILCRFILIDESSSTSIIYHRGSEGDPVHHLVPFHPNQSSQESSSTSIMYHRGSEGDPHLVPFHLDQSSQ